MRWMLVVAAVAGILGVYMAALFFAQRSLLYPIPNRTPDLSATGVDLVRFAGGGYALFLPARAVTAPAPLVIFTHGNGELAADWVAELGEFPKNGISALLVEYPGYGAAEGNPTEASITKAMHAAYDWGAADTRIDPARIVAYGRSLGGGAAARLAADRKVAALILESAFTSVADFAGRLLAPRFMVRDKFDNRAALAAYRGPLLVIHGTDDTIVPIDHGRQLAAIVPGATFHELDCGHNDCPRQWRAIGEFLRAAGVMRSQQPGR